MKSQPTAQRHHLDRQADQLAEQIVGDGDRLLNAGDVSRLLGVSIQFLTIGRTMG